MREEDCREVADLGGFRPVDALKASYRASSLSVAVYRGRNPVCMLGVSPSNALGVGHPWLLGSDEIDKVASNFLRASRPILRVLERDYAVLTNIVDERNTTHIRWLKWLGFKFTHRLESVGPGRVPALLFAKVKDNV